MITRFITLAVCLLVFKSAAFAQFKEGFIIEKDNGRYPGLIKLPDDGLPYQDIIFRETASAKKEVLTYADLKAFVVGLDSFVSIRDYTIPMTEIVHNGFAKIILVGKNEVVAKSKIAEPRHGWVSNGYGHGATRTTYDEMVTHYVILRKSGIIELTDYNFYHELPQIIADYPELCQRVIKKELKFEQLELIISNYEHWRRGQR